MTFAEKKIDYGLIPVIEVAREVLGQESRERSTANERHFADHGGLFVNLKKNRWYSHGKAKGGDAIDLIRFANDCDYRAAFDWLRSNGYESFLGERPASKTVVAEYDYVDADGALLYQAVRYEPKDFRQRRSRRQRRLDLERPGKAGAIQAARTDSERHCSGLNRWRREGRGQSPRPRFTATCNHGGEGKWWPDLTPYFKDRRSLHSLRQ